MKINKKFLMIIIPLFVLFATAITVFAAYMPGKITSLDVYRSGDTVYIEGKTSGFTSDMRVLIKVLDDYGNLQFFDDAVVSNSSFTSFFVPMNMTSDGYLNINISGDLAFSKKYYYSTDFSSRDESDEYKILKALQDYKYYKDKNSKYAMQFVFTYEQSNVAGNVILTGTNFTSGDALFTGKDSSDWNGYLSAISKIAKEISGKSISISVFDKNGNVVDTYPKTITAPGGNTVPTSASDGSYSSNGNNLSFTASIMGDSTNKYIKIKFVGNFAKEDDVWMNSSLADLEKYAKQYVDNLKNKYNADFDLYFYDKNNKPLNTYSFYYYQPETIGNTVGDSTGEKENNPDIIVPSITPTEGQTTPTEQEYTESVEYAIWNPYVNDNGVYTLNLMMYNGNSSVIDWALESEGYEGASYKYNYVLNDYDSVSNVINNMRNDTKKVIIVRGDTLGSNIKFTVPANIVQLLRDNNVTLVLDTSYLKIESDFGTLNAVGDYVVSTNETIAMISNKATGAYNISIKVSDVDAAYSFGTKSKVALHYNSDGTSSIRDLRFVSNYLNNSTCLNTTVSENMKAFISNYYGEGIYVAREIYTSLNDSNFYDNTYKRYAEIVVSKGIMDANGGTFNPKFTMSRGEFSMYLARKLGANSSTNYFNGLNGSSYAGAVNGLYELSITPPIWTNNIDIDKKITIEEMIYMTVRAYEVNSLNPRAYGAALYFQDKEDISAWAKNKVAIAAKLGFIPEDGLLYPRENGTREDAAELIFKLMDSEGLFR